MDRVMIIIRMFFIQILWNYNRMMGYGFCFVLAPLVKKYGGTDGRQLAARYDCYFNTHPYMSSFLIGAVAGLEKQYAETHNEMLLTDIENIKLKMMGPLAALGDSFFWGALKPFFILCAAVFIAINKTPLIALAGLAFYLVSYNIIHVSILIRGFTKGYTDGKGMIKYLKMLNLQKKVDFLRRTAIILLGVIWGFGMISIFFIDLRLALSLLAASVIIMSTVRKIPNITIFYITLILLLIGGII